MELTPRVVSSYRGCAVCLTPEDAWAEMPVIQIMGQDRACRHEAPAELIEVVEWKTYTMRLVQVVV